MEVVNLFDRLKYIEEVAFLTEKEWGLWHSEEEFQMKVKKKMERMLENRDNPYYAKLLLLQEDVLIGFISIFPKDGEERTDLTPWYSTMYVKKDYRGKGYSKLLNAAILREAKRRGFSRIYLKSSLENYYEKFGAIYMETLQNSEKLYFIDL